MTYLGRAGSGALAIASAIALTIATATLAACDNGPDRAAQADLLKVDVESQLQVFEKDWAGGRLSHTGLAVVPEEGSDRFLVTVDGMKLTPEPGSQIAIGQVTYKVTPKDEKTFLVSDLKVPAEMPFTGPDGATGKLQVNVKSYEGLWSREIKTFLDFKSEIADIVATESRGGDVRVQSASLAGKAEDKGGGLFDMTGTMVVKGASIAEGAGGKLSLGEMTVDGKYDSIKLQEYLAAVARIQALTASQVAAAESGAAAPAMSPEDQKQLGEQMMIVARSIKGADWKLSLSDLGFAEAGGATPFHLAKFDLSGAMSGLDGDKAALSLAISHDGLAIDAPETNTPMAKAVLPRQGKLSVKITEVPTQALSQAIAEGLPGAIGSGQPVETGLMTLGFSLQSVLASSGVKIAIEPSGWSGDVTKIDAEGAFNVDAAAIFGVIGTLNVALHGLDDLLAMAQADPASPESQQVIGMGAMLQSMANRGQGQDGKPVDQFRIDLTQQGEMLINGKPMGM